MIKRNYVRITRTNNREEMWVCGQLVLTVLRGRVLRGPRCVLDRVLRKMASIGERSKLHTFPLQEVVFFRQSGLLAARACVRDLYPAARTAAQVIYADTCGKRGSPSARDAF